MDALSDLESFLHAEIPQIPALIKVGLAHAQFETIHPFLDGNGRVGRFLITFLLCEADILRRPVLYLSHHFRRHQQAYYSCLQAVRDNGDWEGWLRFFLDGVATVANEATEVSRRIVDLREGHRNEIIRSFGRAAGGALKSWNTCFAIPSAGKRHPRPA
jgi:Fic family protein